MKGFIPVLLCSLLLSPSAPAGTITSSVCGNWNSTGTWVGGVIPASTDCVIIASGDNVNTNGSRTCAGITITGTLSMNLGNILTVNGNVSGSGIWSNGRVITLTGNWTFNGTSTAGSVQVNFVGSNVQTLSDVLSSGSGDLLINKTGGSVTLGSNMYVGGIFTMTSGTFDAGSYLLTAVSNTLTAGTLRVGTATWAGNYSFTPAPPPPILRSIITTPPQRSTPDSHIRTYLQRKRYGRDDQRHSHISFNCGLHNDGTCFDDKNLRHRNPDRECDDGRLHIPVFHTTILDSPAPEQKRSVQARPSLSAGTGLWQARLR